MSPTLSSSFKPAPFQRNTIQDPLGANDADLSPSRQIDMDRLADGLQKLGEDDLLVVVQMVHDNKSAESYTKNDVERTSIIHSFILSFFLSFFLPLF
jgi:transcription initiation factor TFIID/TFIIF subunit